MKIAVTVILPTYNWSSVLRYAVASVLRQTFTDFELLVIGDGCTDDSESVAAERGDSRVRWINLPENTRHQSGPNNEGLRQARGEIIAYHGHDDLWLPHHLEVMVRAMRETGADLAHSLCLNVPPDSAVGWPIIPRPEAGSFAPPLGMTHRRSLTERIGGWRHYKETGRTSPDVELWRRAAASGARFTFVPRLTGVKFPASWRRQVYHTRPHHEQAAWSARIEADPDFEMHQLAAIVASPTTVVESFSYGELVRSVILQTFRRIRRRRDLGVPLSGERSIDFMRRFKGL